MKHWDHDFYVKLVIRSFVFSEINAFRLSKFSQISFAFNIFVPIPAQKMLRLSKELTPMDVVYVTGNIDQETYLKKFRGGSAPLAPVDPPMLKSRFADFDNRLWHIVKLYCLDIAMTKYVDESESINCWLCTVLVSYTIIVFLLDKKIPMGYAVLVKKGCSP